jgi:hypothetical protein
VTVALVPHWSRADGVYVWAEAVAVLAVMFGLPFALRRARRRFARRRAPSSEPVTAALVRIRDTEPCDDTPAWTAGAAPAREDPP